MLTKLDAINACLRGVGLSPVSSIDSGPEAADALATVDNASVSLQSRGWWFNKEYNWKLTPDASTGKIPKPADVLDIDSFDTSRDADLTARGGFIYDKLNHTYNLSNIVNSEGVIEFVFIVEVPFNDLPEPAKLAVMYRAKRLFAQDEESDSGTYRMQSGDEANAMAELHVINMKHQKRNAFQNPNNAFHYNNIGGFNSRILNSSFPKRDS